MVSEFICFLLTISIDFIVVPKKKCAWSKKQKRQHNNEHA